MTAARARTAVVGALARTRAALPLPPASRGVARPRAKGPRGLQLGTALVASDLAPAYLRCWPLARRAWAEIVGVDPVLVLVAAAADVPSELAADPSVQLFEPVPGVHTALQAQVIRLLYPALLPERAGIVTADVDMLPLSADYFHRPLRRVARDAFVAYRAVLMPIRQIPMCYNAALPATWAELFQIGSLADVRSALERLGERVAYGGSRGGEGWDTDQELLYGTLLLWAKRTRRAWVLDDRATGFRRLERSELRKPRTLSDEQRRRLRRGGYTDYHAFAPDDDLASLNDDVLTIRLGG